MLIIEVMDDDELGLFGQDSIACHVETAGSYPSTQVAPRQWTRDAFRIVGECEPSASCGADALLGHSDVGLWVTLSNFYEDEREGASPKRMDEGKKWGQGRSCLL